MFWVAVDKFTDPKRHLGRDINYVAFAKRLLKPKDGRMACLIESHSQPIQDPFRCGGLPSRESQLPELQTGGHGHG